MTVAIAVVVVVVVGGVDAFGHVAAVVYGDENTGARGRGSEVAAAVDVAVVFAAVGVFRA